MGLFSTHRTDHGSARFAHYGELRSEGWFEPGGLAIGRAIAKHRNQHETFENGQGSSKTIRYLEGAGPVDPNRCPSKGILYFGHPKSQEHLAVIAPTRMGKTVGVILPNCHHYLGSMIAVDVKGELTKISARHRQEVLGHDVHVIDPMSITGFPSSGIDPLSYIDQKDPGFGCNKLASILMPVPLGRDPYWSEEAQFLMSAFLGHIVTDSSLHENARQIGMLRDLIMDPDLRDRALSNMQDSPHRFIREGYQAYVELETNAEKQLSGVRGGMRTATQFLQEDRLRGCLANGSCDLRQFKSRYMSIYLACPVELISQYPTFTRLILELLLDTLSKDDTEAKFNAVMLVDEFSNLGKMDVLVHSLTIAGSLGIRIVIVTQDLGRLYDIYGKDKTTTILDNCKAKAWIAPSGHSVNELSSALGKTTVTVEEYTQYEGSVPLNQQIARKSQDWLFNKETNDFLKGAHAFQDLWYKRKKTAKKTEAHAADLMSPDQLNNLHEDLMIITRANGRPILAKRLVSYRDSEFKDMYQ